MAALIGSTSCVPEPSRPAAAPVHVADARALLDGLALTSSVVAKPDRSIGGPAVATPRAAPPFVAAAQNQADADRALECLTTAVYYEAGSESEDGQRAVAQVVLNRVRDRAFPASVCGVVYQGSQRRTGCQFSFTCDGSLNRPRQPAAWNRARAVAEAALAGSVYAPVGGATFYHANYVMPWWAASMTRITTIGAHLFYRWRGAMERTLAFRQSYAQVEPNPPVPRATVAAESAIRNTLVDHDAVTVHRGSASATPMLVSAGVRIHRGALPDLDLPRADGARISEEDGAI
ncbi:cell wall hydrolase [Sphingomonas rubra]|uniref:cell wall hydrolase n=1 Tax=Sphingomonas rubra TaxID=634430 RepID=UPI001FE166AB|nr:cell wall hydrolase [Sphingomonas rubra]